MWPRLGPLPTYSIVYGASIVVHFLICARVARRLALSRRHCKAVSVAYLIGMTVGAKALFDLRRGEPDLTALLDPAHYLGGGLWGGLLAYVLLVFAAAALLRGAWRDTLDLAGLSVPVPWMVAKSACVLGGCCYGLPSALPWAIRYPDSGGPAPAGISLHPTPAYEILVMAGALLALKLLDRKRWRGTLLLWLLLIYGTGRALTDAFRGDLGDAPRLGPLTVTQWACVSAAVGAAAALGFARLRSGLHMRNP